MRRHSGVPRLSDVDVHIPASVSRKRQVSGKIGAKVTMKRIPEGSHSNEIVGECVDDGRHLAARNAIIFERFQRAAFWRGPAWADAPTNGRLQVNACFSWESGGRLLDRGQGAGLGGGSRGIFDEAEIPLRRCVTAPRRDAPGARFDRDSRRWSAIGVARPSRSRESDDYCRPTPTADRSHTIWADSKRNQGDGVMRSSPER